MTYAELKRAMPWAGEMFLRANCEDQGAEPERPARNEPLEKVESQKGSGRRFQVSIVSFRCVILDADNPCAKSFVDQLRYFTIIPDDNPALMVYGGVSQVRVRTKAEEKTEIHVQEI